VCVCVCGRACVRICIHILLDSVLKVVRRIFEQGSPSRVSERAVCARHLRRECSWP
jgi:hypothetical protein